MVKSIPHGHAQKASGVSPELLTAVYLDAFLALMDNPSSNDALLVLLSRNEESAKKSRRAFTEVMMQLTALAVQNPLMLPFVGLFPVVSPPSALAILDGTVDIEVKVQTKAIEAVLQVARHLSNSAVHSMPTAWPPSTLDVIQIAGGNFESYRFSFRQGQKGSGGAELYNTCPGIQQAVAGQIKQVRYGRICVFSLLWFMGHAPNQSNQYRILEEPESHNLSPWGADDGLPEIDDELATILDVSCEADAEASSCSTAPVAASPNKWRFEFEVGSLSQLPAAKAITFSLANPKAKQAKEKEANRGSKRVQTISVICNDLPCQYCQNTCKH
jgi:hypothetical protein